MIFEKFLVFFAWFYIVYTSLVLLLLVQYTRTDGGMWFLLLQSTFSAGALAVRQLFPGLVDHTGHLNIFKAIKPLVFALEGVHLFVLGILWEVHSSKGATFQIFYPIMMFLKAMELLIVGMINGHKHI